MDEKLAQQLSKILSVWILHEEKPTALQWIEQAFREAGWHPRSECLKHIDLEKMPDVSMKKVEYFKDSSLPHYEEFNQGVESQRQACIDWLKQQVR